MNYAFTEEQIINLIRNAILLYDEYVKNRGRDGEDAIDCVIVDTIDSLQADLEEEVPKLKE